MTENAKKFAEMVSADETLQAELTAAFENLEPAEQLPTLIEFAKKKGFELTKEDFEVDEENFSMDELEAVNGGGYCACGFFGAGEGDDLSCRCKIAGKGTVNGMKGVSTQGGCVCGVLGVGATRRH